MIEGESGTGKELFAQSIHNASGRKKESFVAVNCAALPENLLESELFGYEDGAFTGSRKGGKIGLFELAHKGTLFLDEISEIPLSVQSKLLRVLQEREVRRIGGDNVISVDVRIIAATNRNLKKMVSEGTFRQDLLYRLDVLNIYVPPLRKRHEDAEDLFLYYLEIYADRFGGNRPQLTPEAGSLLREFEFVGNVRELRNVAERISVLYEGEIVTGEMMENILYPQDVELPEHYVHAQEKVRKQTLKRAGSQEEEKELIRKVLEQNDYNNSKAAEMLGVDRTTLWRKMKKYDL